MEKEKAIEVINSLITINNDRIEGYEMASEETQEKDLKTLFAKFISTSQKCKQELVREVYTLGGEEAEGKNVAGKFFRLWMELIGKDRNGILNSCEHGEDRALDTYNKVLENDLEHLNFEQQNMIIAQKSLLNADHEHVKELCDAYVDASN